MRLTCLQRQQMQLMKVEKELQQMIANVNESLNALKVFFEHPVLTVIDLCSLIHRPTSRPSSPSFQVEELQLKSYAVSCCINADGQEVSPMVLTHEWQRNETGTQSPNIDPTPSTSAATSLTSTVPQAADYTHMAKFPLATSDTEINKQEIDLQTFRSAYSYLKDDEMEEEEDDEDGEDSSDDYEDDENDGDTKYNVKKCMGFNFRR